jgi:hypothetical protein
MRVSWEAHESINFELGGSPSAIFWLHKNIVSMRTLNLKLNLDFPTQLVQAMIADGR